MKSAILAAVSVAFCLAATAAIPAPPVEAFGNLPAISRAHISPDGKHLATIEPVEGRPVILVYDLDAKPGDKPVGFDEPGGIPVDMIWANNDRLVCLYNAVVVQNTNQGLFMRNNSRAISVSISGKDPYVVLRAMLAFKINGSTIDILGRDPDGEHVYLNAYGLDGNIDLFRADVEDEQGEQLASGLDETGEYVEGPDGIPAARLDYTRDGPYMTGHVMTLEREGWREAIRFETVRRDAITVAGVSQDGKSLVVLRRGDRDTMGAEIFPLHNGTAYSGTLYSNPQYDVTGVLTDPWNGAVNGVVYDSDKNETVYFDPQLARIQRGLEAALPGETVQIVSYDAQRENMIAASGNPQKPTVYWLYNTKTHQMRALAAAYPTLQPGDLGEMKPYPYKARDGLDIHAYLTLPPGKDPHNLPVVIFPHGGPELRDAEDFDWWAQFMASRGYAVLQPNYRGSDGYGWKFTSAGFGQWGRGMQDDISDGVKKLIADGIADPKRVCIVGASYGGYAALAGATFTPDLYACAVSVAGISNLPYLVGSANEGADYWKSRIGDVNANAADLAAASPALHAGQVKAPVLLIHCTRDVTVPEGQSNLEQIALKKAGKDVNFITIDGDDHYLNLASTRIRVLKEIETFLDAHIGH